MIRDWVLWIVCLFSFVIAKDKATLEIVMHRSVQNGEYKIEVEKIEGYFTSAGSMDSAEGPILQVKQAKCHTLNAHVAPFRFDPVLNCIVR